MGQIQQAITSAIGSAAVGAIAKGSIDKLKEQAQVAEVKAAGLQQERTELAEYYEAGGDEFGFTAAEREAMEEKRKTQVPNSPDVAKDAAVLSTSAGKFRKQQKSQLTAKITAGKNKRIKYEVVK